MKDGVDHHHDPHGRGVEGVDERLVRDDVPAVSLQKLDSADDAANHDQDHDQVYGAEVVLPVDGGADSQDPRRVAASPALRVPRDEEEDHQRRDLRDQTPEDDRPAHLDGVRVPRRGERRSD